MEVPPNGVYVCKISDYDIFRKRGGRNDVMSKENLVFLGVVDSFSRCFRRIVSMLSTLSL